MGSRSIWRWNPAPDTDSVYNVNICNNGSTASTEVILSDMLPLSTTLSTWWAQDAGWLGETAIDHVLVVSRPSLAAWSCSEVYLRVHLDESAWPGMELENWAAITAANEAVSFSDASTTNGAPFVAWAWTFGDGGTSTLQNPAHTYTTVGVYSASLTVTDSMGYTATHTETGAVTVETGTTYLFLPLIVQ